MSSKSGDAEKNNNPGSPANWRGFSLSPSERERAGLPRQSQTEAGVRGPSLPHYSLASSLAREGLHATDRDPNRKLSWVNSICTLFLLIGVTGSKPASIRIKPLPPIDETVAAIVEPLPPPPPTASENREPEQTDQEKPDTPQVVVVTPDSPSINFTVPTIENLLVAAPLAKAPPLRPMQAPAPLKQQPATLNSTGIGGERPQPPYPKIALEQGQQGTVILLLNVDDAGVITSIEVKTSSGFPILDRSALEYVKRHWTVPPGAGGRVFEATINYQLQKG